MKERGCLSGPLAACHPHVPENSRSFSSLCTLVVFGLPRERRRLLSEKREH